MDDKNFMSYGDAETVFTEYAENIKGVQAVIPSTASSENKLTTESETALKGTTDTSPITDSADGMVQGLRVYGRSEVIEDGIKSVGDNGLTVQTTGKNLLDESLLIVGGISGNTHTIRPSDTTWMVTKNCFLVKAGTYTVSSSVLINRKINVQAYASEELITNTFIRKIIDNSSLPQTFTLSEDTYIAMDISVGTTVTSNVLTNSKIQLELGSTATAYESYRPTSAEFATALPLRSVSDTVRDKLICTADVKQVETVCGKVRLADLTWLYAPETDDTNQRFYSDGIVNFVKSVGYRDIANTLSQIYTSTSDEQACFNKGLDKVIAIGVDNKIYIVDKNYTTVSDFVAFLGDAELVYELAEPITTPLTTAEISSFRGLRTYDSTTYINITDDPDFEIDYLKNTENGQAVADVQTGLQEQINILREYSDNGIYGFIEHMDVLSPSERIEYIGANKNFSPVTVNKTNGTYDLGDWEDFTWLKYNKPYMVKSDGAIDYQLDETDYTKKLDGTASDVSNQSYAGGAFSWAKCIYKSETVKGNDRIVKFSMTPRTGFEPVGFKDEYNNVLDGRWIPMFYGSVVDGKATSIAGTQPSYNIDTTAQYNAITAFSSKAKFLGGAFVETLIDLMYMFAGTTDIQSAFGNGNMSGYVNDSSQYYGVKANAVVGGGQFYGTSDGTSLNKIFHSIVLGSYQQWLRDPYELVVNGKVKVSKNYTYDLSGSNYFDTGITVPDTSVSWKYPLKYITVEDYGSIPDINNLGGSTAIGVTDGTYTTTQSTFTAVALRFGACYTGSLDGARARFWNSPAASAYWDLGFAVLL